MKTDQEINHLVAVHVAGWMLREERGGAWFLKSDDPDSFKWVRITGPNGGDIALDGGVNFATSVDAVLPLIEKHTWRGCSYRSPDGSHSSATVEIVGDKYEKVGACSDTLPRAMCIALLRVHGHEVE